VVEPLRDGRLCITSIIELAKVLTPENREEVLPRFFHRTRQEAKAVSAELCPTEAAPHRTVVTALPMALAAAPRLAPAAPVQAVQPVELAPAALRPPAGVELPVPPAPPRSATEPLTGELRRLHVTVSKRFTQKLEAAREALSHSHPGAEVEEILEAGLDLLLERAAKRKGLVERPRTKALPPPPAGSRSLPAAVKREVWLRDEGRCQWTLENGERCGSTHRLQFDHVHPVALGGGSTVSNVRVLCSAHNLMAARRSFGDALMDRYAPVRTSGAAAAAR
jgi:hypothetical protein